MVQMGDGRRIRGFARACDALFSAARRHRRRDKTKIIVDGALVLSALLLPLLGEENSALLAALGLGQLIGLLNEWLWGNAERRALMKICAARKEIKHTEKEVVYLKKEIEHIEKEFK